MCAFVLAQFGRSATLIESVSSYYTKRGLPDEKWVTNQRERGLEALEVWSGDTSTLQIEALRRSNEPLSAAEAWVLTTSTRVKH